MLNGLAEKFTVDEMAKSAPKKIMKTFI